VSTLAGGEVDSRESTFGGMFRRDDDLAAILRQ
jgi:hypothetical protein